MNCKNKLFLILIFFLFIKNSNSQSLIDAARSIRDGQIRTNQKLVESTKDENKTVIIDSDNKPEIKKEEKKQEKKKVLRKSIMLSDEEQKKVEEAVDAFFNNKTLEKTGLDIQEEEIIEEVAEEVIGVKEQSIIYLNAILYISNNNWIAWINTNKITSENNSQENALYIKSINKNQVEIRWLMGLSKWKALTGEEEVDISKYSLNPQTNEIEVNFTLKTNQTYNLTNNLVTEGRLDKDSKLEDIIEGVKSKVNNLLK